MPSTLFSQEIYLLPGNLNFEKQFSTLYKYNGNTCILEIVFEFEDELNSSLISPGSLSFHPDGRLYMISESRLIAFNVLTRRIDKILPLRSIDQQRLMLEDDFAYLAISEEGRVVISDDHRDQSNFRFQYIDYDLRHNRSLRYSTSEDLFGVPDVNFPIGGFLKDNNPLFVGEGGDGADGQYNWDVNSYGYWDITAGRFDTVVLRDTRDYSILAPSVYLPPCEPVQMLSTGSYNDLRNHELIHIYPEAQSITEICPGLLFPEISFPHPFWAINGVANTTDFRQSSLRIDLDGDNSSFHPTAGYYDSLTTCRQEAPLVNDDIELYTCEDEVDSISFRLAYFVQPRLPEEFLTAEGFEEDLRQVSPARYVWRNTNGNNIEQIKDFLHSLRYHADWNPDDPEESRERVVITTMHVGEDSTSSWTVFQLERDEVYAGRDTVVEYCPAAPSLDLNAFLSEDALSDGRFEPEPSGGDGLFIPGTDEDGEYQYIVESGGCADTAILTVQDILVSDPGLDTVHLCRGGRIRIGFPPGKFSDIRWWDGSSGDSIWVEETEDATREVQVNFSTCGLPIPVHIMVRDSEDLIGPDTTLLYCPEGEAIDIGDILSIEQEWSISLSPALQNGILIFTPGIDPSGAYELIVNSEGGCADTAMITFQESPEMELSLDDIQLCEGQERVIGLPADTYQSITWWNGTTGDSTTIRSSDTGPFTVEAQNEGCTYRGTFEVTVRDNIDFPESYPDSLEICPGQIGEIIVQGLDSINHDGNSYREGDPLVFTGPGEYVLIGYDGDCSVQKTVTITTSSDLSTAFDQTLYWCEGTTIPLTLPPDSADLIFIWDDGQADRERIISSSGEYSFEVQSGSCTFQSRYTVLVNDESECEHNECRVSIPNAVTPNGDGWNDGLEIFLSPECGAVESVTLWDKWGGLLHQTNLSNIEASVWAKLPGGIYIVQVSYIDESGQSKTETGSVLVIL